MLEGIPIKSHQHERPNKDNTNGHGKMKEEKPMKHQTDEGNYKLQRKAESWRNNPLYEQAHQLVVQYQILPHENVHSSNIVKTKHATFIFVITIKK